MASFIGCLLAGVGSSYGFGNADTLAWLLPILGLVVLFTISHDKSVKLAALYGYLFGFGHFITGIGWTWASLHNYGHIPISLAGLIAGGLCAMMASYYALATATASWIAGSNLILRLTFLAGIWLLIEYLRDNLFSGFGWLAAGYSQVATSPLAGYVPVIGIYGTTGIVASVAASISIAIVPRVDRKIRLIGATTALLLMLAGTGLNQLSWTTQDGEYIAVSVLQGAVPQDQKWRQENLHTVPRRYIDLAKQSKGRLIVTPEAAVPAILSEINPAIIQQPLLEIAKQRSGAVILGSFGVNPSGQHTNSAVILPHDGDLLSYSKRKLTPYGEYLPFAEIIEPILQRAQIPFSSLAAGEGNGRVQLEFVDLGLSICYEDAFSYLFRTNNAKILVNLTDDSWFDGTNMAAQHLQISAARALETGRYLIRASNTGSSAVIAPDGTIVKQLAPDTTAVLDATVAPFTGQTPFHRFGPILALVLGVLLVLPAIIILIRNQLKPAKIHPL